MRIYIFFILFTFFNKKRKKMDTENYISPSKITKQYDITSGTLRRWSEAGKIRCLRPNGGKRIYNIQDIKKIFNAENSEVVGKRESPSKNNFSKLLDDLKNNIDQSVNKEDLYKSIKIIEQEFENISKIQ
jgi:predicted site-specific integrase-resolvase